MAPARPHNKSQLLFVFSQMLSPSLHWLKSGKPGLLALRLQLAKAVLRFGSASNPDYNRSLWLKTNKAISQTLSPALLQPTGV